MHVGPHSQGREDHERRKIRDQQDRVRDQAQQVIDPAADLGARQADEHREDRGQHDTGVRV